MALLEVQDLRLSYDTPRGPLRAVDGVSFSVPSRGQAIGVIGETGSGKTSVVSALTRMLPRNVSLVSGEALFEGSDLLLMPMETYRREVRWKKIAVVPQGVQNGFNPVLRIGEQVAERALDDPGADAAAVRERTRQLLETVGLPAGIEDRYPHELSGGMKQRAAIAMALTMGPALLILDEPTSALDVSVQAQIMNLLKKLKWDLGLSMVFITHDIALASDLCDRFVVLAAGIVREEGTAEQVLREPRDPYTRQLLASIPRLRGEEARPAHGGSRPAAAPPAGASGLSAAASPEPASGPPAAAPLVSAEGLGVHFTVRAGLFRVKTVRAVEDVSLAIDRAQTLALVGESGSGKTTLGRALLRLVAPAAGTVSYDGKKVTALRGRKLRPLRKRAQAIFQDPYASISPFMDVQRIVEEPLVVHGVRGAGFRRDSALRALESVGLLPAAPFAAQNPHTLSGGQRQRVCIARAIVLGPEFVVADEPVSMVDASSRAEILRLLGDLQAERGIAFLYITHDIASARQIAQRIAVMYLGTIVEEGPAAEVVERPAHPYSQALLAAVPEPDPGNRTRLRQVIPGEPPRADAAPRGCPFHPRCPQVMKGRCDVERPAMREVSPGHSVACFLYPQDRKPTRSER